MSFSLMDPAAPNNPVIMEVGPAGSSKTTFGLRLVKPGKKLFFVDADLNTVGPVGVLREKEKRDLSYVVGEHLHQEKLADGTFKAVPMTDRYQRLAALLKVAQVDPQYSTIFITSTTSLVDIFKAEVLRQVRKPEGTKFEFSEWDKFLFLWTNFIANLRACGKTVVLDGHVTAQKGDIDQILRYALAIPGQTGDLLPMRVTDVWRFQVDIQESPNAPPRAVYNIYTIQDTRNPNIKTSLQLPTKFEATQEWADKIMEQTV